MKKIINEDLSLNTYKFTINDTLFLISKTREGEKGLFNTIDTIKNTKTNSKKDYRRADLKIMLKKFNAKFVSSELKS
jgi:hypothetical protein